MTTYFLTGKYSPEALKGISSARTKDAVKFIKKNGGKVVSMYALLGDKDLVLIIDFPDLDSAVKTSVALAKKTGISFSTTPALPVEKFDQLTARLK